MHNNETILEDERIDELNDSQQEEQEIGALEMDNHEQFGEFLDEQMKKKRRNEPIPRKEKLSIWIIAISTFFISVATILGTGILGLPVKLYQTGFWPFFSTFVICLVMQAMIIIYLTDILQKTEFIMREEHLKKKTLEEREIIEEKVNENQVEDIVDDGENATIQVSTTRTMVENGNNALSIEVEPVFDPDLHTIGRIFLNRPLQILFDVSVIVHFVSILISYSIAGPIAMASLCNIKDYYPFFIAPFVFVLSLVVIFGDRIISHVISAATLFKGTLLLIMVGLVGFISTHTNLQFTDKFQYIGHPFLIGTVSLGGVMNTLPVSNYSKIVHQAQVKKAHNDDEEEYTEEMIEKVKHWKIQVFRASAILALLFCFVINVLWCLFVLKIVPQESPEGPSLQKSKENGEISTIPIIEIVKISYPEYVWLGYFVQGFISLSITVSFVTMSIGMVHMLHGYVKTFENAQQKPTSIAFRFTSWLKSKISHFETKPGRISLALRIVLYLITFIPIYIIAQINPHSFLIVMEVFTSMALNLESGFFISFIIFLTCVKQTYQHVQISVPLPKIFIYGTVGFVCLYFMFAVVFDIVYTIIGLFWPEKPF